MTAIIATQGTTVGVRKRPGSFCTFPGRPLTVLGDTQGVRFEMCVCVCVCE